MTLRIRQIVLAARDLDATIAQLQGVLGVPVCYHDPGVAKFGLKNALMTIGHRGYVQFLEVVSPIEDNTAAGRHLDRHGDSGYMLILQTDDLSRDRARFNQLGVRIVWESTLPDISAVHLHPKDIGAAIVSIDQPVPPESWRWAGPEWQRHAKQTGAQRVTSTVIGARGPAAMAQRYATVLGTTAPIDAHGVVRIGIEQGTLDFVSAKSDVVVGFGLSVPNVQTSLNEARRLGLPVHGNQVIICGTRFDLNE